MSGYDCKFKEALERFVCQLVGQISVLFAASNRWQITREFSLTPAKSTIFHANNIVIPTRSENPNASLHTNATSNIIELH